MAYTGPTLSVIENSGPNNLRDVLKAKCTNASEVCIAVAFVTDSGLSEIINPLREAAAQGRVRLVTGLYQCFTEAKALETLLIIQEQTRGIFSVRISREPQFHRKVFLFEERSRATAIIGSSNLTSEGLVSGGELCVMLSMAKDAASYRRLRSVFDKDWGRERSVPLTQELFERYRSARPPRVKSTNLPRPVFKRIVEPSTQPPLPDQKSHFWRDCIIGFVKPQTEQIISQTTNWDKKNYWWYGTRGRTSFRIGDQIFLFDFPSKRLTLVEVKEITHTPVSTLDGRNFVAYKDVRNYSRRFSKKLWAQLKSEGIPSQRDAQERRNVKLGLTERLKNILRSARKR